MRRLLALAAFVSLASFALPACHRSEAATLNPGRKAASEPDAAPAPKPFGALCLGDAECAGAVCFHKRLKGPDAGRERRGADDAVERDGYCSLRCNDDADCPVPPTKGRCGARGMCKRPD